MEGEGLVECDTEGVDVGALIEEVGVAGGLFRAHVAEASEHLAGECQSGFGGLDSGESEVGYPEFASMVDEQVGGFDVAVDDAAIMSVVEGFGGLDSEPTDGEVVVAAAG